MTARATAPTDSIATTNSVLGETEREERVRRTLEDSYQLDDQALLHLRRLLEGSHIQVPTSSGRVVYGIADASSTGAGGIIFEHDLIGSQRTCFHSCFAAEEAVQVANQIEPGLDHLSIEQPCLSESVPDLEVFVVSDLESSNSTDVTPQP